MDVTAIYRSAVDLIFDYYLLQNNERARKLAHGTHRMAWVGRNSHNEPMTLDLPSHVLESLLKERERHDISSCLLDRHSAKAG